MGCFVHFARRKVLLNLPNSKDWNRESCKTLAITLIHAINFTYSWFFFVLFFFFNPCADSQILTLQ